jgi:GAF domain-containing protein
LKTERGKGNSRETLSAIFTAKSDISNSGLSPCHIEFLANFQIKANLVAPILMGDELWGLLAAHHCANPRQWQDYEIELIRQVAIQAGVAIQQADLFQQVQKEALRIQTLFNTSFDGIVILDEQGKVLDANPRFSQMLGYTREEAASLSIFDWEANFTKKLGLKPRPFRTALCYHFNVATSHVKCLS